MSRISKISPSSRFSMSLPTSKQPESTKPITIQEFLGVSPAKFEQSSYARPRTRTTSVITRRSSLLRPSSPSSSSPLNHALPYFTVPLLSPLGSPLLSPCRGLPSSISHDRDSALFASSASKGNQKPSDQSNSDWNSDPDMTDTDLSEDSSDSFRTLAQLDTNLGSTNHGVGLFAGIPLIQEVQEYSDTDSFFAFRDRTHDSDDRSIRSSSTNVSHVPGPLLMSPFSSAPGTPVDEEEIVFEANGGVQQLGNSTSRPALGLNSVRRRKESMVKLGHSFMKALELPKGKKFRM